MRSFNLRTEPSRFAGHLGIVAAACLSACGPPRYSPVATVRSDPAALLAEVRTREERIESLRARFKATAFHGSDESVVQGVLLVRKPDRFRMRLMLPFGITVLDYVSHGDRDWTLLPLSRDADTERARLFSPADVRETFLRGAAAFPGTCSATGPSSPIVVVNCRSCRACPLLRSLQLNRNDGTISEETSYDESGPRLSIRYGDYRRVSGLPLPFHVVMSYPTQQLKVEIEIGAYEVNPQLKETLFEPPPGAKMVVMPDPKAP
jgi:hypothetical protein